MRVGRRFRKKLQNKILFHTAYYFSVEFIITRCGDGDSLKKLDSLMEERSCEKTKFLA